MSIPLTDKNIEKVVIELARKHINFLDIDKQLKIDEIGDGNINYIFRLSDGQNTVIAKFADNFFRGSNREISTKRSEIESYILKIQNSLSLGNAPEIFYFDKNNHCIFMEDLSDYITLRDALQKEKTFPQFGKSMAIFLYNTLFKTTDLVLDSMEKKKRVKRLINTEMCEISERLVFTEPYMNLQKKNIYHIENEDFVTRRLYKNKKLLKEVAVLKNNFKNNAQSMIHGDLHAGSVFVKENDMKVFDPEFSFYGPMGYDIGNIIGNLIIYYVYAKNSNQNQDYTNWLEKEINNILNQFIKEYENNFENDINDPVMNTKEFKQDYLNIILNDTFGYAGTEIIRRTVGAFKVPVLTNGDKDIVKSIETALINIGIDLILQRNTLKQSSQLQQLIKEHI